LSPALKVTIPRLAIPALKIGRGRLLDISIMGVGVVVPPSDIQLWPEVQLLPEITVFDPGWITDIVTGMMPAIAEGIFKLVEPHLDKMAEDFYARRGKEKT